MKASFFELRDPAETIYPDYPPVSTDGNSAVCRKSARLQKLTAAQREAAIRRGLAAANSHEAKARHFRALVAQLKEMTDGQA